MGILKPSSKHEHAYLGRVCVYASGLQEQQW